MEIEVNYSFLLDNVSEKNASQREESILIIAIYFSASWCNKSIKFTKKLIDFYQSVNKSKKVIEIFFASSDTDEEDYKEYIEPMPWKSFPLNSSIIEELETRYSVCGIPRLVILSKEGHVIKNNGRKDVCFFGDSALEKWLNPSNAKVNELWKEIVKGKLILFPNHMHKLTYTTLADKVETDNDSWFCNECGNYFDEKKPSLYCAECNYDCCEECFKMNIS